jgi:hypothetical protein
MRAEFAKQMVIVGRKGCRNVECTISVANESWVEPKGHGSGKLVLFCLNHTRCCSYVDLESAVKSARQGAPSNTTATCHRNSAVDQSEKRAGVLRSDSGEGSGEEDQVTASAPSSELVAMRSARHT